MNRRLAILVIPLLAAAAGITAVAASECSYPAQECLDYLAKTRDRGFAGVDLDDGWTVRKVYADTPAAGAGIRIGDVLLAIGDVRMGDKENMPRLAGIMKAGNTVRFTILREGKEQGLDLHLVRMSDDVFARYVGEHMLQHAKPPEVPGVDKN